MPTNARVEYVCIVCDESVSAAMSADCNWCNGRYHLNQRNDIEAKDCGQVWVDEQYMALQFACDNCLQGRDDKPAGEHAAEIREIKTRPAPGRAQVRRRYKRRD